MLGNIAAWVTGALEEIFDVRPPVDAEGWDTDLIDLQCGRTVYNDVPSRMRTELWASALHKAGGPAAGAAARYPALAAAPLAPEVLAEIEKDTHRTFPGHRFLGSRAGQAAMLRVLRAYAAADPEVGYAQGMNFLAGLMLAYLDEPAAFAALVLVMQGRGLRDLYRPDDGMALLQVRLWQLGRLLPPPLASHLENHAALPVLYASSWFLTCFAADWPLQFAARVLDVIITDSYSTPMMLVAVHIVERCGPELMKMDDMEDIVELLRRGAPAWPKATLQDLLTEALGKGWTARQAAVLREMNGAESVADAVARVEAAAGAAGGSAAASPVESDGLPSRRTSSVASSSAVEAPKPLPGKIKIAPLPPPPPAGRRSQTQGGAPDLVTQRWRPPTPLLKTLPSERIRIDAELAETSLDPALTKELSTYLSGKFEAVADRVSAEPTATPPKQTHLSPETSDAAQISFKTAASDLIEALGSPFSPGPGKGGAFPSPFESQTLSKGTSTAEERSGLSSMATSDFADFTGAEEEAAASGATTVEQGAAISSSKAQGGSNIAGGPLIIDPSAAGSLTYLLADLSMSHSTAAGPAATTAAAGPPQLQKHSSSGGFGSFKSADVEHSGGGEKSETAATAESMPGAAAVAVSPASSRALLLQKAHLEEFSVAASAASKEMKY